MKQLLTLLLLSIATFTSGQVVNIPDANFRNFLLNYAPAIDTDADGQIQESEAQSVIELFIDPSAIVTDITGIKSFSNLQTLWTSGIELQTAVDLSDMTQLRQATFENSRVRSISVANCINLEMLDLNNLGDVGDSVTNINVDGARYLRDLFCDQFNLSEFDVTQCDSLITLNMGLGRIQGILNVSGLTKLENMYFEGSIGTINAANAINLKKVWATAWSLGVTVNEMNFQNCRALEQLIGVSYNGTDLDFSSCLNLEFLSISGSSLRTLNLKNGLPLVNYTHFSYGNTNPTPLPLYVCVDDLEADKVTTALIEQNGASLPFTVNPFCTSTPGGIYNTINGKVRWDADANGCTYADPGKANVAVRIFDGTSYVIKYTSGTGEYVFHRPAGNYSISPYFPYPFFSISPSSASVIFDTANNLIDSANFCITSAGSNNDLEIVLLPLTRARPGFNVTYQLTYKNRGTSTQSGTLQFNYDNSKMTFNTSTVTPNIQSPGLFSWNYSNLAPFESRSIQVGFSLLPPPINNINDTLMFLTAITPVAGDASPGDNNFILPQRITGSYDPNDKDCLQGERLDITRIGDDLHYIIRFQNLGNDTAFNVVVTDTLSNNLDWDSFVLIATSHAPIVKRTDDKLEFYFQNIELPNAGINEPGSHGFVAFKVKSKTTLVLGDSLNNTASIYFDYNPSVVTNTISTIVSVASGPVPVKLEYFSIRSKMEFNQLTWKVGSADNITIFNIEKSNDGIHFNSIGIITATAQRCLLPFDFTDNKPLNGKNYYRIKITESNGPTFYSRTLVTGETKTGFVIKSISSDQNTTVLYVEAAQDQTLQIKLVAADGRVVFSQDKKLTTGLSYLNLQTHTLPKGVYTLIVNTENGEQVTKRFVK